MRYPKTTAVSLVAAVSAAVIPFLHIHEGTRLESYPDVGTVWTICSGVTTIAGKPVKPGMKVTQAQCDDLDKATASGFVAEVATRINIPVSEKQLISHVTFAYNIGIGAYKKSKTLRYTNAGDPAAGCRAMMNFYTAGGKDCRIRSSNCPGLITRRQSEMNQCLEGLL